MVEREAEYHKLTQIKDTILQSCHPNALPIIKQSFAVLEASWHRVSSPAVALLSSLTIFSIFIVIHFNELRNTD